jgi:hypothetical protein
MTTNKAARKQKTAAAETQLHDRYNALTALLDELRYGTEDGCDVNRAEICEAEIELAGVEERLQGK